jgi:hypothetical protein
MGILIFSQILFLAKFISYYECFCVSALSLKSIFSFNLMQSENQKEEHK